MHVTRVELENIKSYKERTFDFARGTTAITGENGAGKTTILEAIAWALFDTLEYSKEDFLRRGAKRGHVRVTFETSPEVDGRQYTVYRDTGNGYYIYDPALGLRIAEKKTDVSATLRKLLGIEIGTDIKSLFRSAIGVPQGSFTAEFLLAPNARKAAFDRILKVEEYRDGAERLRDTVNLVRERTMDINVRIGNAEGQLARYDEQVAEHKEAAARVAELTATLDQLRQEIESRERVVVEMDQAETLVNETRARADRLNVEHDAAVRRLSDVRVARDAARAALERQRAVEADHKAHLESLELLGAMEAERVARDRLRVEESDVSRLLVTAKSDVRRLEESLERAVQAAASVAALEPDIAAQDELERERERLRDLRAEALSARDRLAILDKELDALRKAHTQTRERVKEAEAGREATARVERLESERLHIETTLSATERAATSHQHLTAQRRDVTREVERLRRETAAREKEITELEKRSLKAVQANELSARENELTEQLAQLKAEIARDRKFQSEVKNGLCPILSERCLNIGEDQTLEDYFKGQFATNAAQLGALEKERAGLAVAVSEAREAEKHLSRLEGVRGQFEGERRQLAERVAALARIDDELKALPDARKEYLTKLQTQMLGLDGELKDAREAAMRHAELQPLRQRLQEIEDEGKLKKENRADVSAAAEGLVAIENDITETDKKLRALDNPRGRADALRKEAETETARRNELTGAMDAARALDEQARAINAQLDQYKGLDARWDEARFRRDRTIEAHREYIASESVAASLPAREQELEQAEAEASRAAREAEDARVAYAAALAAYNREQHATERAALAGARERAAATTAQLDAAKTRESSLAAEIARLAEVREQMREAFLEKEKLEKLNETTEFIRDTLKKAGPLVTESYLYNISIEANQLFREITGEAGRALRWSRDYEILLEEEGHERSFPNLSGGEQMAAALAVRLALLKQLSDIRLAFFDEPTVNMDAERRRNLAQQIGQIQHFDQLFVISHDDTFEESVDHIIHITRDEDGRMKTEGATVGVES